MLIQVHSDHTIHGSEQFATQIRGTVESALSHHAERITRVEVHLADENGSKQGGDDKRCSIEARIAGHQPMAVTHHGPTVEQAVDGAVERLSKVIDSTIERLRESTRRPETAP